MSTITDDGLASVHFVTLAEGGFIEVDGERRTLAPGDIVLVAARSVGCADADTPALTSLWAAVRARPGAAWGTEDLAARLGVSRTVLYRMVKQTHGSSPAKIVEHVRMGVARRLLTRTRHSIAEIADEVGYANAFSFSAAFKRVVGVPPSAFRAAGRAVAAPIDLEEASVA